MGQSELLPFGLVPIEAALDNRLSKGEIRMLIALFTFRNRTTELFCPKREQLADRTGYSISMVSRMTTQLAKHGWLTKTGDGRYGRSASYVIHVPRHLTIVATAAIVAATAPLPRAATATPPRAATATLNKQTSKQTSKQTKENPYFSEIGVESEFAEYKTMRKQIRKPMNETSIKLFITALKKILLKGHSPAGLIETATANSWLSVYEPKGTTNGKNGQGISSSHGTIQTPLDRHFANLENLDQQSREQSYVDGEVVGKNA